jgi:ATP-binding cassette subfamily B protein
VSVFRAGLASVAGELFRASAPLSAALALLVAMGALVPLVVAVAVADLVRAVPAALDSGRWDPLQGPFIVLVAAFAVGQLLDAAREGVSFALAQRVEHDVQAAVMRAGLGPDGVEHLHAGGFADVVAAAGGTAPGGVRPMTAVLAVGDVAVAKLSGLGALLLLARWHLWVPVVLGVAWASTIPWLRREGTTARSLTGRRTEALRRAAYFRDLALEPGAAKELRLFGLGPWLIDRYVDACAGALAGVWSDRRRHRGLMLAALIAITAATGIVYGTLAFEATSGRLPLREVALFAQLALATMAVGWTGDAEWLLRAGASALAVVRSVPDAPVAPPRRLPVSPGARPPPAIAFHDVSFTYPGEAAPALRSVNFSVPAGASVALVGDNGAGKSTTVKLLAALYQPAAGAIVFDGVALGQGSVDDWRSRLACILQDFTRYEATLRDNVALGVSEPASVSDEECLEALGRAGAGDLLRLPEGLHTMLGEGYENSTGLSGGQWQRIALARALLAVQRGADLVVLDEPTAALDVRAEAAFFDGFFVETKGLTRLVVSHRLASVRRADLIVVLHEGTAVETGTHAELLAADGRYAAMYRTQASAFASPPGDNNPETSLHV